MRSRADRLLCISATSRSSIYLYIFSSRPVSRQIFSETDETRQSGGKLEKPRLVASLSQGGHVNHRTYADAIFVVREEVSREIKPRLCAEITSRSPEKALPFCTERSSSRGARLCTQGTGRELQRVKASHALVQHIDIGSAVKLTIAHPAAIKGARATAGCARKTRRRDMRLLADDARHARFTHIATSLFLPELYMLFVQAAATRWCTGSGATTRASRRSICSTRLSQGSRRRCARRRASTGSCATRRQAW